MNLIVPAASNDQHIVGSANDAVTKERMAALVGDLETQIATVEAKDSDAPPE